MPRPRNPIPSYRFHKASGQAIVTLPLLDGRRKDVLLGGYDTPESRAEYARVIGEWQANHARTPGPAGGDVTVNEMVLAFLTWAKGYYSDRPDTTSEFTCLRDALRPVRQSYGHTRAADFGPLALKAVMKAMADAGLARTVVNARANRIRRAFKWAASEELVPVAVHQALATVKGYGKGRGLAREAAPVKPVDPQTVEATLPFLPPPVAAMCRVQLATGMRPGEVCRLRADEIDTSGTVWVYAPGRHKTAHRGTVRTVFIGPRGQEVLGPWLAAAGGSCLFSPYRAEAARNAGRTAARKTPRYQSHMSRNRDRRVKLSKRPRGDCYTTDSYGQAVAKGVDKANAARSKAGLPLLPRWSPNQIRHQFATEVRAKYGLEAAQVLLGHAKADVTQVYAERDQTLALRVAAEAG